MTRECYKPIKQPTLAKKQTIKCVMLQPEKHLRWRLCQLHHSTAMTSSILIADLVVKWDSKGTRKSMSGRLQQLSKKYSIRPRRAAYQSKAASHLLISIDSSYNNLSLTHNVLQIQPKLTFTRTILRWSLRTCRYATVSLARPLLRFIRSHRWKFWICRYQQDMVVRFRSVWRQHSTEGIKFHCQIRVTPFSHPVVIW